MYQNTEKYELKKVRHVILNTYALYQLGDNTQLHNLSSNLEKDFE